MAYFAKPTLIGFDSYFFYNMSCGLEPLHDAPILSLILLNLLPCGLFFAKLVLFGLALISLFWLKKIGELVSAKWGFLAPIFFLCSPAFTELLKFEDDQFSFPFIFSGIYYLVRYHKYKKGFDIFKAIGAFLIALGFWKGSVYFLLTALFSAPYLVAFGVFFLIIYWGQLTANLIPNFYVWENYPVIGLLAQHVFLVGYYSVGWLMFPVLIFTGMAFLKAKFFPYLTIFLTALACRTLEKFNSIQRKGFFVLMVLMCAINTMSVFSLPFNENNVLAVQETLKLSQDLNMGFSNNLVYGYYIQSLGVDTWKDGGMYDLKHFTNFKGVVLETFDFSYLRSDCSLINSFGDNYVFVCGVAPKEI